MLYIYSKDLAVTAGSPINFNTNVIQTGCTATHSAGSSSISLNRPGFYKVELVGSVITPAGAGDVTITMYENGVASNYAFTIVTTASATDNEAFVIDAVVQVLPNCAAVVSNVPKVITFVSSTTDAEYNIVSAVVTKLA